MNTFFYLNNLKLDKYQSKAVYCDRKSYLVIAGAGSGKTLTIVAKIKYLVSCGVNLKSILCISFTNETVDSLKSKLESYDLNVDVKTFHKLSLDILGKRQNIAREYLLEYITNEFFCSFVYFDNTYKLLNYVDDINTLKNIIVNFINQMKTRKLNINFLYQLLRDSNVTSQEKIVLVFTFKVFLIYEEELKSEHKIDFNDMINLAVDKVDTLSYFKYSYIIIDEYQDTSYCKYLLIKELFKKFNINIMAVGDDYQSIYSFTGCDLKLFTSFKKYFKNSKIIKLRNTYRNSSDIVEISKRFVMRNRNQINKRLISNKYIENSINIIYCEDEARALSYVFKNYNNIMVLGRNNKDIDQYKNFCNNARFLTIHASKGLEEENIVILNAVDDVLGLPNKIKINEIFNYINMSSQIDEERRLFYVALTRAKSRVFILTKNNKESIFILELLKRFRRKINIIYLDKNL